MATSKDLLYIAFSVYYLAVKIVASPHLWQSNLIILHKTVYVSPLSLQLNFNSATSASLCSQGTWMVTLSRPLLLFMHVSEGMKL